MALRMSSATIAPASRRAAPMRIGRTAAPVMPVRPQRGAVLARAEKDFDAQLMEWADKFEKAENKPAIVAYGAAAVSAFIFIEWLIHLPALDILLGFPVQLLGVLSLPVIVTRYVLDKKDFTDDAGSVVSAITSKLPGLKKD